MVLFFVDKKGLQKNEKGHLGRYYMMCYTACHDTCLLKWPPNEHEQPGRYFM